MNASGFFSGSQADIELFKIFQIIEIWFNLSLYPELQGVHLEVFGNCIDLVSNKNESVSVFLNHLKYFRYYTSFKIRHVTHVDNDRSTKDFCFHLLQKFVSIERIHVRCKHCTNTAIFLLFIYYFLFKSKISAPFAQIRVL